MGAIDNHSPLEDRLELQIKAFIKQYGIAVFLEYVARIIKSEY